MPSLTERDAKLVVKLHDCAFLAHEFQEVACRQRGLVEIFALVVDGRAHEVDHRHSGISTGYWNDRNSPSWLRSSGDSSKVDAV